MENDAPNANEFSPVFGELAAALRDLSTAVKQQTEFTRLLWSAIKPAEKARLLGVSPRTERRRRKKQEIERLLRADS